MCGAFLWSGNPNVSSGAKVAWTEVCKPKAEGGLGLRRLRDVSLVFAYRLIWRLFTLSGSLWVAWTKKNLMKGGSFWSAPNSTLGSWIWKKLLKLREDVKPFIRVEIGDGEDASYWFDTWMPQGSLLHITGPAGPRQLGIPLHATVKEATGLQGWKLRRSRSATLYPLIQAIRVAPLPHVSRGKDQFLWKTDMDGFTGQFHSLKTWEQIRETHPLVPWGNLIWFRQGIPRCGFISWLAIQNRLSTGERMCLWGKQQHCVFCREIDETRDHLFFACPHSFTLWSSLAGKLLRHHLSPGWEETVAAIQSHTGDKLRDILIRLCFQVSIYVLWRERNSRIHNSGCMSIAQLIRHSEKLIRNRISSLDYPSKPRLRLLLQRWLMVKP